MPIIPELTDSYNNLSLLYKKAKESNVNFAVTTILNLRGETKIQFLKFIKNKLPHLYTKINSHYNKSAYVNSAYQKHRDTILSKIEDKYPLKEKETIYPEYTKIDEQLSLF